MQLCSGFWHWKRTTACVVIITFATSLISPTFASINYSKEQLKQQSKNKEKVNDSNNAKSRPVNLSTDIKKSFDNNRYLNVRSQDLKSPKKEYKFLSPNNIYQPYFELGGAKYFNQAAAAAGIYDLFIPLYQQTENHLLFTNLRIFDRSGNAFEGNVHIGYRRLYPNSEQMVGVYGSFDRKRSENRRFL